MKLGNWQKGTLYGFIFAAILSFLNVVFLVFVDFRLEKKGLPHMCFIFTDAIECTLEEALMTRFEFLIILIIVFGTMSAIFGGLIGYLIDRIGVRP